MSSGNSSSSSNEPIPGSCPTPLELGRAGWAILHSSAAVYPHNPSPVQQDAMRNFIESVAQLYACNWCAYHMRQYVQAHPPCLENKFAATRYVCELHNEVNARLGKGEYDCDPMHVLRRWHPGFPDKMNDQPSIEERLAEEQKRSAQEKQKQREAEAATESRLSVFGWQAGKGRKGPEDWRVSSSGSAAQHQQQPQQLQQGQKPQEGGHEKPTSPSRWWFFGASAYADAPQKPIQQPQQQTPSQSQTWQTQQQQQQQQQQQKWREKGNGDAVERKPMGGRAGKVADSETDVDAVLARLRGCQVYCPEDEEIVGAKTLRE